MNEYTHEATGDGFKNAKAMTNLNDQNPDVIREQPALSEEELAIGHRLYQWLNHRLAEGIVTTTADVREELTANSNLGADVQQIIRAAKAQVTYRHTEAKDDPDEDERLNVMVHNENINDLMDDILTAIADEDITRLEQEQQELERRHAEIERALKDRQSEE